MISHLRYALRMLRKAPGFTAVALLTLALGIGANTAIFTLVDATLLRPLPVSHPEQLAMLTDPTDTGTNFGTSGGRRGQLAYSEYLTLRDHNSVFSGLLAAESDTNRQDIDWADAGQSAAPEPAVTKLVSSNYFAVLGVPAARGRVFLPSEGQQEGADPVAVISYGYWTRRFGRDPNLVGRAFRINGHVFTVVGIAPRGFFGENVGQSPDLFLPLTMQAQTLPGRDRLHDPPGVSRLMWLQVIGRLKPGVSLAAAQSAVNVVFGELARQQAAAANDPQSKQSILGQKLELSSGANGASAVRGQFHDALLALMGLVGLVLLLAVVNLASLLLARAATREREISIRLALGSGRRRIVGQLLTESVLLSVLGGLLGAALAVWGVRILLAMVDTAGDISLNLAPDLRVLAFVAALCVGCGVLFGLIPAWRASRHDLAGGMGKRGVVESRHRMGKALVAGQVAISIVLVVGSGLFIRSLQKLRDVPLGFNPAHLLLTGVSGNQAGYKGAAVQAYLQRVLDAVRAAPGVRAAAYAQNGLFSDSEGGLPVSIVGLNGAPDGARFDQVSGDYFASTGIPILAGRALNRQDQSGAVRNAVINQTMRKKFFGARNPLGMQIRDLYPDDGGVVYTVVGVAADAKYNSLDEKTPPRFYLPVFNGIPGEPVRGAYLMVRGAGGDAATIAAVRDAIRGVDPSVRLQPVRPVETMIGRSLTTNQLLARLSGFFGGLALLLAAIGLYGVLAYGVSRRTPEIGIRMALGAGRGNVVAMVLRESGLLLLAGLLVGVPVSLAAAKAVASQIPLFGLSYYDPASLAWACLALALVALAAGGLPARRASRVDPLRALRED